MHTQGENTFPSGPEPDLGSGAMLLRTSAPTASASESPRPNAPAKAKPSVPQKKTHMDEIYRLRKEKDDTIKVKNMMEEELLQIQDELQDKDDEVERLYKQIQELNAKLAEADARLKQSAAMNGNRDPGMPRSRLDATAKVKIEQLRAQLDEAQKEKFAAQAELKIAQESFDQRLLEAQQSANTQIEAVQKHAQSETGLNEQMGRMEIDSGNRQQHAQTIAKLEEEIQDQRRRCEQFRRTSERLTTQIKQVNDTNGNLARSEREAQRRMEGMKSRIAGLEGRLRDGSMPGSYY